MKSTVANVYLEREREGDTSTLNLFVVVARAT